MRSLLAAGLAVLLLAQSACGAGWRQPQSLPIGPLAPHQQAQVFSHGHAVQWHAVRVDADTVSGIPFTRPVDCDSCRERLARSEVDSIRLGNPVGGFWKSVGLVVGGSLLAVVVLCTAAGGCPAGD